VIKKIFKKEKFKHCHLSDVKRIQTVFHDNGFYADLEDCVDVWQTYSDIMGGGWMSLPQDDHELWYIIQRELNYSVK